MHGHARHRGVLTYHCQLKNKLYKEKPTWELHTQQGMENQSSHSSSLSNFQNNENKGQARFVLETVFLIIIITIKDCSSPFEKAHFDH